MSNNDEGTRMKVDYYMELPYSVLLREIKDESEKYWIAEVPELPGCKSHGSNVEEAIKSLEEAKRDWIQDSIDHGDDVPVPIEMERYSGKTLLRIPRSLHRSLSLMAETEKISLNQLIATILAKEVGRFNVLDPVGNKIDYLLDKVNSILEEQRTASGGLVWNWDRLRDAGEHCVVDAGGDIQIQAIDVPGPSYSVAGTSLSMDAPRSYSYFPWLQQQGVFVAGGVVDIKSWVKDESKQK